MLEILFTIILGLCVGSFLNVLIDRLPQGERIGGRSRCDYCKRQLAWSDLIPVVSYVVAGGRCRYCKKRVSWYYPLVELLTSGVFVGIFIFSISAEIPRLPFDFTQGSLGMTISAYAIASALIVIFFADLKYHIIPDEATFALIIFSLLSIFSSYPPHLLPPLHLLLSNLIGGVSLLLTIYFIFFVTRGRGMGFGDVKLAFAMGFLLGLSGGFLALYIAFVTGGIVGLALLLLRKKGLKSKLPFGPFLVLGTAAMLLAGKAIMLFFKQLFGFNNLGG